MADEQTQPQSPQPSRARRSSFAGQTFADLFGGGGSGGNSRPSFPRGSSETNSPPAPQPAMPGPISQAAAQAQRRRMSLTTIGLSGSPNQTSPFGSLRGRRDSIGSANSGSIDESAIAEDEGPNRAPDNTPASPFARRSSFGAKALRDRMGSFSGQGGGGGGSPPANGTRSPPTTAKTSNGTNGTISSRDAKGRGSAGGEGFNWSENFRNRAERTSIAGQGGMGPLGGNHSRAKSVAVMEPPPEAQMPKPKEKPRPDHFQERILKGDFYMD